MHYVVVDPAAEWSRGFTGWWFRGRGMVFVVAVVVAAAVGTYAWFADPVLAVTVLLLGGASIAALLTTRRRNIHRIKEYRALHAFAHETRDAAAVVMRAAGSDYRKRLDEFNVTAVQCIAVYFRALASRESDRTINCAIRLAENVAGRQVYRTRARSDGLDPSRHQNSVSVPADAGIPGALRSQASRGVFIIRDIEAAIVEGLWLRTPNDTLPDMKTLMVAPVNGWESGRKVMLGLLYVTAQADVFKPRHAEVMKVFADVLGLVYPIIMHRMMPPKLEDSST